MTTTTAARTLHTSESPALDAFLAGWGLAAAYARSHLREQGLHQGGVRAAACPPAGERASATLDSVLVGWDGIGWALWQAPEQARALAAVLPGFRLNLLSGPRPLVEPLIAQLPRPAVGGADKCPFERVTPAGLRPPPADHSPAPRRATLDDMERLIDFYIRGFYSLAQFPTRAAWRTRLTEQLAHRTLYLIEQDGVVLSAAQSSAETSDAAMIGGVATLAAYRNRGLSARCVYALCAALFESGVQEIGLFYLPANIPAARVYAKLGFQPAGEWWLQRLNFW